MNKLIVAGLVATAACADQASLFDRIKERKDAVDAKIDSISDALGDRIKNRVDEAITNLGNIRETLQALTGKALTQAKADSAAVIGKAGDIRAAVRGKLGLPLVDAEAPAKILDGGLFDRLKDRKDAVDAKVDSITDALGDRIKNRVDEAITNLGNIRETLQALTGKALTQAKADSAAVIGKAGDIRAAVRGKLGLPLVDAEAPAKLLGDDDSILSILRDRLKARSAEALSRAGNLKEDLTTVRANLRDRVKARVGEVKDRLAEIRAAVRERLGLPPRSSNSPVPKADVAKEVEAEVLANEIAEEEKIAPQ